MNKYMAKAERLWRENQVNHALQQYKKALNTHSLTIREHCIALYMSAYLHCVLVRRAHQTEAFLGVDLRQPHQDGYLQAGIYLAQIRDRNFDAAAWGLPLIDKEVRMLIDEAHQYYLQFKETYINTWQLHGKVYLQQQMLALLRRIQQQIHA